MEYGLLSKVNNEALLNAYLYLLDRQRPTVGDPLKVCVKELGSLDDTDWNKDEKRQLEILKKVMERDSYLAETVVEDIIFSGKGLTAGSFVHPDGKISVVFRGTGTGEWVDNGEGLSGITETNTYFRYDSSGNMTDRLQLRDYATTQQAEALNWFNFICAKNRWTEANHITISGHSKGGNKAQFVTMHTDLVDDCYTFHAQGFSPEAIQSFKNALGTKFDVRQAKIMSFASENDCVHSLGYKLCKSDKVYYFKSKTGLHDVDGILNEEGYLNSVCPQGKLSECVQNLFGELMELPPIIRKQGTVGAMNIFQKYVSKDTPISGNDISMKRTIAGMIFATGVMMAKLKLKYGNEMNTDDK